MTERSPYHGVTFGYVPYSDSLQEPGDRRRFCYWADQRRVSFEIARPGRSYDIVVLSARADLSRWPHHPRGEGHLVFDLIDSYLSIPSRSPRAMLRGLAKFTSRETQRLVLDYRAAIERMCRRAEAVICSTPEQRESLLPLSENVHPILDAHATIPIRPKADYARSDVLNLAWEGLPYTVDDFEVIAPVLRDVARRVPLALHLVTDLRFHKYARRFGRRETFDVAQRIVPGAHLYSWNEQLLGTVLTACDLAVVPLDLDDPFARAKPENKLLLLWRMGLPVVASATPAYRRVMAAAELDLTCTTAAEWTERIERLAGDEGARADAGRRGAAYVAEHHSTDALLRRWDAVFDSVLT